MKKYMHWILILSAVFALSLQTGCSSKKVNENDPKEMYDDAESDVKNDRYLLALDKFRVVKSKFSYTSYGPLAQLRIADVYFLQESYPEAASSYETFVELYPKHEKASYALYKEGESQFLDIPSNTARDLKSAESAIQTLGLYIGKYPGGEYIQKAHEMKQLAYDRLAQKELSIAEFYIKRKKPDSARLRLNKILDEYSGSSSTEKAKELLRGL